MDFLEILSAVCGLFAGLLIPYIGATRKVNGSFDRKIYWQQNKDRLIAGMLASLVAVGATFAITPEAEAAGSLFNGFLFTAAATPIPTLNLLLKKTPNK